MQFDSDYFNSIAKFLNDKDGVIYNIEDLTDDYDKFVFHVKYYIDNCKTDEAIVEFNNEYTKLKVYEFFEGKIKEFDPNGIHPTFWRIDRKQGEDTTKQIPVNPEPIKKSTNGLFASK